MWKKSIIVTSLVLLGVTGCGNAAGATENEGEWVVVSEVIEESDTMTNAVSKEVTEYNLEVFDDDFVNIVCKSISGEKVTFLVTSKMENNEISVLISRVALDGIVPVEYYGEDNWLTIQPQDTVEMSFYGYNANTEHATMSAHFEVFNNAGSGVDSIDVVDFNLGKEKHIDDLDISQILMFSNENLDISYAEANMDGIRLRVNNKLGQTVTMAINDPVTINEKEYTNTFISVRNLPPYSISDYYIRVMDFNPDYVPEKIESFVFDGYTYVGTTIDEFVISPDKIVEPFDEDSNVENSSEITTEEEPTVNTEESTTEKSDISSDDAPEALTADLVEASYMDACTLTEPKLDKKYSSFLDKTSYYYNGLIIQSEDLENLNASWNTEKALNQGALYRTMAMYLEGFSIGLNNGSDYAELLCGQKWVDKASFAPYVENASEFIITDSNNQLKAIMKKMQSLSSVTGDFDFDYGTFGKYTIDIPDLSECAKEMQVSEQMLGYILALLDEYAPEITFDGNSCHIEYISYN